MRALLIGLVGSLALVAPQAHAQQFSGACSQALLDRAAAIRDALMGARCFGVTNSLGQTDRFDDSTDELLDRVDGELRALKNQRNALARQLAQSRYGGIGDYFTHLETLNGCIESVIGLYHVVPGQGPTPRTVEELIQLVSNRFSREPLNPHLRDRVGTSREFLRNQIGVHEQDGARNRFHDPDPCNRAGVRRYADQLHFYPAPSRATAEGQVAMCTLQPSAPIVIPSWIRPSYAVPGATPAELAELRRQAEARAEAERARQAERAEQARVQRNEQFLAEYNRYGLHHATMDDMGNVVENGQLVTSGDIAVGAAATAAAGVNSLPTEPAVAPSTPTPTVTEGLPEVPLLVE